MTWYSQAGTPELVCQLKYDARTSTADLTISQVLPPTPGEAKKKPLHMPVRLGLLGGNGQDIDLTLASGKRLEDGVVELTKRTRDIPLPRRALPAGAVAAARLLGARQPDDRPLGRGPAVPDGQRQRPLQSLAGGAGLRNARAGRDGEGPARRQAAREAQGVRGRAGRQPRRREPRPRLPRPVHVPAERERHCPHHRPRRGPARHPQRAQGAAQGHRHHALRDAGRDLPQARGQGALFAGAGSGRQAGPAQRGARLPGLPRQAGGRGPRSRRISPAPATPPTR